MANYPTVDKYDLEYFNDKHKVSDRSIPRREIQGGAGVVSSTVACYISKMVADDHYAAIFNYSIPYDRYYLNGVETTAWIAKGDSFTDCKLYEEGVEHSHNFVYRDMGYYGIDMLIRQIDAGFCTSLDGAACGATSVIKSFGTVGDYAWTVTGATLTSGQGTDEIVVDTSDTTSVTYKVSLTTTLMGHSETIEREYIHVRDQVGTPPHVPLAITDITEDVAGSCSYPTGGTCVASSEHTVVYDGVPDTITWSVIGATITAGQGTDTVTIETTGDIDVLFSLECKIEDTISFETRTEDFTHIRTQIIGTPPDITAINEIENLGCEYDGI